MKKTHPTGNGLLFEPPNPASILEEQDYCFGDAEYIRAKGCTQGTNNFEPPNPASVVESSKVFIGKRNHQTEKPQDVLEFLLKYWTDEDNVVLDPTMGSGSTGVACKKLNRKFIGFELDPKIYDVAVKRINKN
jgi:site-specific DNA-methyltransferase (adenine-specific)